MTSPLAKAPRPSPIDIPPELVREVYREARRWFPVECCGWLAGPRDRPDAVDRARPCVNAQEDGWHPTSPERSADAAYVLAADDLLALNRSFDGPEPARVLYHSHSNGRAYFSATDRDVATSPWGRGPAYPLQHLVVGIDARRVVSAALFAWSEPDQEFIEVDRYAGEEI